MVKFNRTSQETGVNGLQSHLNLTNAQLRPSAQEQIQELSRLGKNHDFEVLELVS